MRRLRVVMLAFGMMLLLAACSGKTTGASNITDVSATLNTTASCDQGQTCTWYRVSPARRLTRPILSSKRPVRPGRRH
jgi:hypothetical protein